MVNKTLLVFAASGCALLVLHSGRTRADAEDQLLKKFQSQNQSVADKLRQNVTDNLARASSPGKEDPGKLLDLLRKSLVQLQEDALLPKEERASLVSKVQEKLKDLKETIAKQTPKQIPIARLQPGIGSLGLPDYQAYPGMPTYIPAIPTYIPGIPGGGIKPFSSFTVTPVVGPGGTFVRLGISGSFTIPTMGPLVPIQFPVPSIFYGPGQKFTFGQPESIFKIVLPFSSSERISLNTTLTVPDGGTAVVGGYRSFAEGSNEFGTPGVGKVPYLSRLFRNRATGRQVSSSGISVSVRVISLEEEERKLLGK
jgi:hypothetical protein